MIGWFKIHRQLLDSPLWTCEPFTRGQAWVDLIGLTNHADNYFYCRGIKVDVKRGQCGWSEVALAQRWKWSRSKLRKFLNDLEKEQQIKQQKGNVNQIITIINYEIYQEKEQQTEQQKDNRKTAERQQKDTNKNDNNIKNENNENNILSAEALKQNKILNFKNSLSKFKDKYPIELLKEFFEYWTESDINGKGKMRFEDEKYFDFGRRLGRWKKNNDKINHNYSSNGTPKPNKNGSYD